MTETQADSNGQFEARLPPVQMPESNLHYADRHGDIYYVANGMIPRRETGDSLVFIVEFSDPVRARAIVSYGNASDSDSTYNGDQLELYSSKELRPVWRTRKDIEANLVKREQLSYLR